MCCTGVGTGRVGWWQTEVEEDKDEGVKQVTELLWLLPVLKFPHHALGDSTAQQPQQEEDTQAQCDHEQDVVLRGRGHHLHCQIR